LTSPPEYAIINPEVINMIKSNIKKAKLRLEKIRHLMSKARPRYKGKNKQEIINEIRKVRAKLWEAKFVPRAR